jgi:hypothetical protein
MEQVSRRLFFKQAGTVAALAGAAAVVPVGIGSSGATTLQEPPLAADEGLAIDEHLIAHVTDASTGTISLFVGTREVIIHDRKVAARLVRATRRAFR